MISLNGIVGCSLLVCALRHHLAVFNPEGTGSALATVITLSGLTLVLPKFTVSEPGPSFTPSQLAFAAVVSLALYGLFVFTQTVQHRDFFLAPDPTSSGEEPAAADHGPLPSRRATLVSLGLLVAALVGVVGLAKVESKPLEKAVLAAGLPYPFVGVVIATLVLLPEAIAAVRAASDNRVQVSFNLGHGVIGLTIRPSPSPRSGWTHPTARPPDDPAGAAQPQRHRGRAHRRTRTVEAAAGRSPPGAARDVRLLVDQALRRRARGRYRVCGRPC